MCDRSSATDKKSIIVGVSFFVRRPAGEKSSDGGLCVFSVTWQAAFTYNMHLP